MLNYMRAELYKLFHRKYFWGTIVVFFVLEALLLSGYVFTNAHGNNIIFSDAVMEICLMLPLGSYFTLIAGEIGFAGQYKNSTLKNEVSFGLSRSRIYLGKLFAQLMAALITCFLVVAFYAAACRLLLPSTGDDIQALVKVGKCLLAALPIWLGMQALVCACFFLIRSEIGASALALGLYAGLPVGLKIIGLLMSPRPVGIWILKIVLWLPSSVLEGLSNPANLAAEPLTYFGIPWLVGGVWFLGSTIVGLAGFQNKEIN